jgi:hypothetical protein
MDHRELDTLDLLDSTGIKQYQSLIGAIKWLITLGRFDIHLCVTTMSRYRVGARQGHLDRLKCTYGYLKRHPDDTICLSCTFRSEFRIFRLGSGASRNFDRKCFPTRGQISKFLAILQPVTSLRTKLFPPKIASIDVECYGLSNTIL